MEKRGQVAIFILLGVVILIAAAFVLFLKSNSSEGINPNAPEPKFESYFFFIDSCLKTKAEEAVKETAFRGGYFEFPGPYVQFIYLEYPFYLSGGNNYFPDQENVKESLALMYKELSLQCYDSLVDSLNNTLKVELGNIKSDALITTDSVVFSINYPISIGANGKKESRENFRFEVPAEIANIHSAIGEFIGMEKETTDALCWTCLSDISEKYSLDIGMRVLDEKNVLFSFSYNKTRNPITWVFANEYK